MVTDVTNYRQKAAQEAPKSNLMKFGEFKDRKGGDWSDFKAYLMENGALNPELTVANPVWKAR